MARIAFGVFMVLHGLVHLLYMGQTARYFTLQPGMVWPDGSWVFSRLLGDEACRTLAGVACALAAIGFVAGGTGILAGQRWWHPLVVASAAFSAVVWILLWNGQWQRLSDQGAIAILINAAILVAVLVLRWPALQF